MPPRRFDIARIQRRFVLRGQKQVRLLSFPRISPSWFPPGRAPHVGRIPRGLPPRILDKGKPAARLGRKATGHAKLRSPQPRTQARESRVTEGVQNRVGGVRPPGGFHRWFLKERGISRSTRAARDSGRPAPRGATQESCV